MKIYIPHLHYYIEVKFNSSKFLDSYGMECACEYIKNGLCILHFRKKPKYVDFPTVAHEVQHILQRISSDRNIDMVREEEHFAYLMQFILNKILGFEFERNPLLTNKKK